MMYHVNLAQIIAERTGHSIIESARILGHIKHEIASFPGNPSFYKEEDVLMVLDDFIASGGASEIWASAYDDSDYFWTCEEIEHGFAEVAWGSWWADREEEEGRSSSLSGQEITEIMPDIPLEAKVEAAMALANIAASHPRGMPITWLANNARLKEIKLREVSGNAEELENDSRFSARRFGNCLYYMTVGAGVSWSDDFSDLDFEVPYDEIHFDGDYRLILSKNQAASIASGYASMMHASDPGITLYAFSSTECVQSENHRKRLLQYLETDTLPAAVDNDKRGESNPVVGETEEEDVHALIAYVRNAEVSEPRQRTARQPRHV